MTSSSARRVRAASFALAAALSIFFPALLHAETGQLLVAGDNRSGQLALPGSPIANEWTEVATGVTDVAIAPGFAQFILEDGSLWAMGTNNGVFGDGTTENATLPVKVGDEVAAVFGGRSSFGLYAKADGNLYAAGNGLVAPWSSAIFPHGPTATLVDTNVAKAVINPNVSSGFFLYEDGKLAVFGTFTSPYGGPFGANQGIHDIASGVEDAYMNMFCTVYLTSDGQLMGLGNGVSFGFTNGGSGQLPPPLVLDDDVSSIAGGFNHLLYLKNGSELWGIGSNARGQLGLGPTIDESTSPVKIADGISAVFAGEDRSFFVTQSGDVYGMGENGSGELGLGREGTIWEPTYIRSGGAAKIVANNAVSLMIDADGRLLAAGEKGGASGLALPEAFTSHSTEFLNVAGDIRSAAARNSSILYVNGSQELWGYGALGPDIRVVGKSVYYEPIKISGNVESVEAWGSALVYLKTDGSVWMQGGSAAPRQLMSGVRQIRGLSLTLLFLKDDDTLWLLGDARPTATVASDLTQPKQFDEPEKIAEGVGSVVSASSWITLDGRLMAFGGELQRARTTYLLPPGEAGPEQIDSDVRAAISINERAFLYMKTDGGLWFIGLDSSAMFQDSGSPFLEDPVKLDEDVVSIASDPYSVAYIKSDGSLWLLGRDFHGVTGSARSTVIKPAVNLFPGERFLQVSMDANNIVAIKQASFDLSSISEAILDPGARATLTVGDGAAEATYSWYKGAIGERSTPLVGDANATEIEATGQGTYWVEYLDADGASQQRSFSVSIRGAAFAAWANGFGIEGASSKYLSDDDSDSIDLFMEYALGLDPTDDDGYRHGPRQIEPINADLHIEHPFNSEADAILVYQLSYDTKTWIDLDEGVTVFVTESNGRREARVPNAVANGAALLRFVVRQP